MNREDTTRLASDVGMVKIDGLPWMVTEEELQRFAHLVERDALERAAKVCDARFMGDLNREDMEARACAAAIRALKEQT